MSGCSVRMAASGKPKPLLNQVRTGQTRSQVIQMLGEPQTVNYDGGIREDIFYLQRGYPAWRYTRAVLYTFLDAGTIGLWELIGTPLEEFIQSKNVVTIEYDLNDEVQSVTTYRE